MNGHDCPVETSEHIAALHREGDLLADAAESAGLDADVPSCPSWRVSDLLRHLGFVHRWAARYVAEQIAEFVPEPSESEILRAGPADRELVGWFRDGHAALVRTLSTATADTRCWTFLGAPSPLAFWARRQAHETAMHRADACLAAGTRPEYPPEFASDGIDELIMGFLARSSARLAGESAANGRALQVRATDAGARWLVRLTADGKDAASVARGIADGTADCSVSGPAGALYLLLWNRCSTGAAGVAVSGDPSVIVAWADRMRVRWQ